MDFDKISIIGRAGSGKTTVAQMMTKHGFTKFAFGDAIRQCFEDVFEPKLGRKLVKSKDRALMQYLGDFVRNKPNFDFELNYARENKIPDSVFWKDLELWYYDYCQCLGYESEGNTDDFWIRLTMNRIIESNPQLVVIDDMRYLNEASAVTRNGFLTIRVEAEKDECEKRLLLRDNKFDPKIWEHQSEKENFEIHHSYVINNSGTLEELEEEVKKLVTFLN